MAASERLYELWLLYYAQVSPPRAAPAVPPAPRARLRLHLRPRSRGRVDVRARRADSGSAHTCAPPPARRSLQRLRRLYLGDDPRRRASRKSFLGGDRATWVVPDEERVPGRDGRTPILFYRRRN